jgi:hypothetical protein
MRIAERCTQAVNPPSRPEIATIRLNGGARICSASIQRRLLSPMPGLHPLAVYCN